MNISRTRHRKSLGAQIVAHCFSIKAILHCSIFSVNKKKRCIRKNILYISTIHRKSYHSYFYRIQGANFNDIISKGYKFFSCLLEADLVYAMLVNKRK